jgi:hypothetical protein
MCAEQQQPAVLVACTVLITGCIHYFDCHSAYCCCLLLLLAATAAEHQYLLLAATAAEHAMLLLLLLLSSLNGPCLQAHSTAPLLLSAAGDGE